MTSLLELREKIKIFYSRNELYILPVAKFLLAFVALVTVNAKLGYMAKLDNLAIVLIVSLLCSFLPSGCMVLFVTLFSLLHLYELALEAAVVGLCIYMVLFLVFFRFCSKNSIVLIMTSLLCMLGLPYIMPIAVGLLGSPVSAIAIGCGILIYYFLASIVNIAPTLKTVDESEIMSRVRLIIDELLNNKVMLVVVTACVITMIAVYVIRRLSINQSWTIAMVAGALIDMVILLIGDFVYDTNLSVIGAILGSILAVGIAKVIEFFAFCVDYSRTEVVQFEDDEYYYYVKAVPKMTVTATEKTVKHIK